jgi:hypothetical protein
MARSFQYSFPETKMKNYHLQNEEDVDNFDNDGSRDQTKVDQIVQLY